MLEARAFWLAAPGQGEIRTASLPPPGKGEALVRATLSAISRGTEALVFRARVPASQYATMRCPFQEGDFPAPVKYGYASVGVVEAGPDALVGRRVFCLHPHQDRYVVPASSLRPVPDGVSAARATLAALMETAVNGLWDGAPRVGDRIAIVGAGVLGSLVGALAARIPGARVTLIDLNPAREAVAAALGCDFAAPEDAAGEADLVFHTSGTGAGLATCLRLAGFEARIVELSWYGDGTVGVPLGAEFHVRRLALVSSQVSAVATARRARWSRERRLDLALILLADPAFDCLVTGTCALADLPATMARLAVAPGDTLLQLVRYD
jgi:NADPH:quinone reductase-like Zn-dependent oxidoreductase